LDDVATDALRDSTEHLAGEGTLFDAEWRAEKRLLRQEQKADRAREREVRQEDYVMAQQKKRDAASAAKYKDREMYGTTVCEGAFGLRTVKIYSRGYIKVAALMFGGSASYERLISIEFQGDVQKKTGPGRVGAAVLTGGANLLLTPNKRGDVYLTITTDRKTHVLREDPPNALSIRTARQLAASGQGVLLQLQTDAASTAPTNSIALQQSSVTGRTISDRLEELNRLYQQGMVSGTEFQELRANVLREL
jgi:hypothetical protein